jgi:hypothetical protein
MVGRTLGQLGEHVGQELRISEWASIEQSRIDAFAPSPAAFSGLAENPCSRRRGLRNVAADAGVVCVPGLTQIAYCRNLRTYFKASARAISR